MAGFINVIIVLIFCLVFAKRGDFKLIEKKRDDEVTATETNEDIELNGIN